MSLNNLQPKLIYLTLVLLLTLNGVVHSIEINGQVKYISKSAIYVDIGRIDGLSVSDVGSIIRNGKSIGQIEVLFIADHSSSCKSINLTSDPTVGDEVVFTVAEIPPETDIDSTQNIPIIKETRTVTQLIEKTRRERVNQVSGSIGLQYYSQNDIGEYNYDYQQPSTQIRLNISNIQKSYFDFSIKIRARKTIRDKKLSEATSTRWTNRIYQLSLQYNKPGSPIAYGFGRMQAASVSGMGYFDGAVFSYQLHPNYTIGIFGGTEPNWTTLNINSEAAKFGAYFDFLYSGENIRRFNSTVAFAGAYQSGEIDREYIYLRNILSTRSAWSFYQSADLGINRGWRKESGGQSIELSSLILSVRWDPVKYISFSSGYDNRKTVRDFDNRGIADSLFDDAVREGFRAGINVKLPYDIRMNVGGNMRSKASGSSTSKSVTGGISFYERNFSRIRTNIRSSWYTNLYSEGNRLSVSISRDIMQLFDVMVEASRSGYKIIDVNRNIVNNSYKLDFNIPVTRSLFLSTYYEYEVGDDAHTHNWFVDLGIRF